MSIDENDSPAAMNDRAYNALIGANFQDGGEFVDVLCALLRSKTLLSTEVREELAAALERGRSGNRVTEFNDYGDQKPRLVAEGFSSAKMRRAVKDRRNWFDAGEALHHAREDGKTGDAIIIEIGVKHGLGFEAMRKYAIPFYREFLAAIADGGWLKPEMAVFPEWLEVIDDPEIHPAVRDGFIDDANAMISGAFIWAKAEQAIEKLDQPSVPTI